MKTREIRGSIKPLDGQFALTYPLELLVFLEKPLSRFFCVAEEFLCSEIIVSHRDDKVALIFESAENRHMFIEAFESGEPSLHFRKQTDD